MGRGKYSLSDYAWNNLIEGIAFTRSGIRYECVSTDERIVNAAGTVIDAARWLSECKDCGEGYFFNCPASVFPSLVRCPDCRKARQGT